MLQCTASLATHCNTLEHIATHCSTMQHAATHCNTLQHTATHCNPLQHTATHCNTIQHTATHFITQHHTTTCPAPHCNIGARHHTQASKGIPNTHTRTHMPTCLRAPSTKPNSLPPNIILMFRDERFRPEKRQKVLDQNLNPSPQPHPRRMEPQKSSGWCTNHELA